MKWKSDKKASKPVFICSAHFCAGCGMSGDALHMVNCRRCVFSWHTMCVGAHHQLLPPTYRDHVLCGPCRGGGPTLNPNPFTTSPSWRVGGISAPSDHHRLRTCVRSWVSGPTTPISHRESAAS